MCCVCVCVCVCVAVQPIATNIEWTSIHLELGGTGEKVEALLESILHNGGEIGLKALCNKVI